MNVRTTLSLQWSVFTDFRWARFMEKGVSELGLAYSDYAVIGAAIGVLFVASYLKHKTGGVREWLSAKPMPMRFAVYGAVLFGILIFGAYGFGYDASQFLYSQF
jgi:hypothetical protein